MKPATPKTPRIQVSGRPVATKVEPKKKGNGKR